MRHNSDRRTDGLPADQNDRQMPLSEVQVQGISSALSTRGHPLPADLRLAFEQRFGCALSHVSLHDGPSARASARLIDADAYTAGRHIILAAPFDPADIRLLAHELAHVIQSAGHPVTSLTLETDPNLEAEAERASALIAAGESAGPISSRLCGIARTAASTAIRKLLSYSLTDWAVTADEEKKIMALLWGDPHPEATLTDLINTGDFHALIDRVDEWEHQDKLIQLLGRAADDAVVDRVRPAVQIVFGHRTGSQEIVLQFEISQSLQSSLRRMKVVGPFPVFNTSSLAKLVSASKTSPFTGSGATGKSPRAHATIPAGDKLGMLAGIESIKALYDNPLGDLSAYLVSLTPAQRVAQATLLLKQPICSLLPYSYAGNIPDRKEVFAAAGKAHNLHGATVAAFVLAEQRDQSANEDAKDYQAGALYHRNTSIGLGQIVISTARRHDLFADLLTADVRKKLTDRHIAELLASDEFNIFAAARYIRKTADSGSRMTAVRLPNTVRDFPRIDFAAYARNSFTWPLDNLAALGSEYTSTPWDDRLSVGWGDFVREAYTDVLASGVL
jgi:hypothetical protein